MILGKDFPGQSFTGPLPKATSAQKALAKTIEKDVRMLAETIGERNSVQYRKLEEARGWIGQEWTRQVYCPKVQEYKAAGRTFANLEVSKAGTTKAIIVVGAHYDSARGAPGANDNASGMAVLLALSRHFQKQPPAKIGLRFVAFVNEEPPFFVKETMGSFVYARQCKERNDDIRGMLSLETMGYYSDRPNSQKYPVPLSLAYPSTGDFIGMVGNENSADWVVQCLSSFRKNCRFPSQGAALSDSLQGVGWSDHWSFWQYGYPALMVTDTAPFRYPDYHLASDTPDKLNYDKLARVTEGLQLALGELILKHY